MAEDWPYDPLSMDSNLHRTVIGGCLLRMEQFELTRTNTELRGHIREAIRRDQYGTMSDERGRGLVPTV